MIRSLVLFCCIIVLTTNLIAQKNTYKIAFGACARQPNPLLILDVALQHSPDLFIFLGDNIYGDTDNMDTLQAKYDRLGAKPTFQRLVQKTPIIATWDDHDFGKDDVGRHYPFKEKSKDIFMRFWKEPTTSERWKHEGIYASYLKEINGKKIQIILLDVRTFKDNAKPYQEGIITDKRYFYTRDYLPYTNADSTLLGKEQWAWLEKQLQQKADVRIIGSGSQFGIEYNGYEAWANYPEEQKKLVAMIQKNKTNGVFFLSGDVHYAEISKYQVPNMYPIYDITSSGLSSTWLFATPNSNRIEGPVMENHFGLLTIDCTKKYPTIKTEIYDIQNNQRIEYTFSTKEISFSK